MNYLKKLERQRREDMTEIAGLRSMIQDIKTYLSSPKFHEDPSVNINDIFLRLEEGLRRTDELVEETKALHERREQEREVMNAIKKSEDARRKAFEDRDDLDKFEAWREAERKVEELREKYGDKVFPTTYDN